MNKKEAGVAHLKITPWLEFTAHVPADQTMGSVEVNASSVKFVIQNLL